MERIGKYEIVGKVGEGAMGVVYKARDPLMDRILAIKTMSADLDANPELRERFFREAKSAGQLSHRNIITIYALGEDEGRVYIAMEWVEGEDLKSKIDRREELPLEEKLRILIEMGEGVAHAHERGVVHRDLKPANVRITPAGQVKILDFGLARMAALSSMTQAGAMMGTPTYMSPEQVKGAKVNQRCDIFAAGAISYELLAGKRAFDAESLPALFYRILHEPPAPLATVGPELPEELDGIVLKAMAKDPGERYPEMLDMVKALERVRKSLGERRRELLEHTGSIVVGLKLASWPSGRVPDAVSELAREVETEARGGQGSGSATVGYVEAARLKAKAERLHAEEQERRARAARVEARLAEVDRLAGMGSLERAFAAANALARDEPGEPAVLAKSRELAAAIEARERAVAEERERVEAEQARIERAASAAEERREREAAERAEAARHERERAERLAKERRESEAAARAEAARREQERAERLAREQQERAAAERAATERREAERLAAERREREAAARAEAARREHERAERVAQERRQQEAAEQAAAERHAGERAEGTAEGRRAGEAAARAQAARGEQERAADGARERPATMPHQKILFDLGKDDLGHSPLGKAAEPKVFDEATAARLPPRLTAAHLVAPAPAPEATAPRAFAAAERGTRRAVPRGRSRGVPPRRRPPPSPSSRSRRSSGSPVRTSGPASTPTPAPRATAVAAMHATRSPPLLTPAATPAPDTPVATPASNLEAAAETPLVAPLSTPTPSVTVLAAVRETPAPALRTPLPPTPTPRLTPAASPTPAPSPTRIAVVAAPVATPIRTLPIAPPAATATPSPAPLTIASATRPPTPATPLPDDGAGVRRALDRYEAAYRDLDVAAAIAAYPALSGQRDKLEKAFAGYRSQSATVEPTGPIAFRGNEAEVTARVTRKVTPKVGSAQTATVESRILLRKEGSGWVIAEIR